MTSSMADPDYCPFLQLHPNIELAILEQLEFRDYINLALSCRKWYQAATSVRNHLIPVCMFDRIHMSNGGFMLYFKYPEISKLVSTSHLKFTLVNKIKCKEVRIERKESDKLDRSSVLELVRFLWSNKQYFEIDLIHIDWPQIDDEEYTLLEPVLSMTPFISFTIGMDDFPYQKYFKMNMSHSYIQCYSTVDSGTIIMVLKQVMNRERLNIKAFVCVFDKYHALFRKLDKFANPSEDYEGTVDELSGICPGNPDTFYETSGCCFELWRKGGPKLMRDFNTSLCTLWSKSRQEGRLKGEDFLSQFFY